MSQGINAALTYLEDQIEAVLPKTDLHHGFVHRYDRTEENAGSNDPGIAA